MKIGDFRLTWVALLFFALGTVRTADFAIKCESSEACQELLNDHYQCDEGVCVNTELQRLSVRNLVGLAVVFVVSGIAISAGIGGGAIFTSTYMMMQSYEPGEAIPLSQISILASAVVSVCLILDKRHPKDPDRLLINFPLISRLIPTVAAGSLVGVILNKLLPPILIFVALCYLLIDLTIKIYHKALSETEKERRLSEAIHAKREELLEKPTLLDEPESPYRKITTNSNVPQQIIRKLTDTMVSLNPIPLPDETAEQPVTPKRRPAANNTQSAIMLQLKVPEQTVDFPTLIRKNSPYLYTCLISVLMVVLTSFLRGGKGMDSIIGLDRCGFMSFLLLFCCFGICYFLDHLLFWGGLLSHPNEEDRQYKRLGIIVGVVGTTLGLGGGVVLNPILLRQGLPTQEAFAISGTIVMFNSLISALQFFVVGAYSFGNTVVALLVTSLGSMFGTVLINRAIAKYKRSAFLLWFLVALLLVSSIVQPINGLRKLIAQPAEAFTPGSFC